MFEAVIKILETLCMFLLVSILTWKMTRREVLFSGTFKLYTTLAASSFIFLSVTTQILFELLVTNPNNKYIAILIAIFSMSLMFNLFYGTIDKIHYYVLATLASFAHLALCEIITIGVITTISRQNFYVLFDTHYRELCIIATVFKYVTLGIIIGILDRQFYKKLMSWQKDTGLNLVASTTTTIASTQARFPCWLFFFQPRTPKKLRGYKNEKFNIKRNELNEPDHN